MLKEQEEKLRSKKDEAQAAHDHLDRVTKELSRVSSAAQRASLDSGLRAKIRDLQTLCKELASDIDRERKNAFYEWDAAKQGRS